MTRFVAILALLFSAALFAQEFRGTMGVRSQMPPAPLFREPR